MAKCSKPMLDAAFKAEAAAAFLEGSRLRKWVRSIERAEDEHHTFVDEYDVPPKAHMGGWIEPGKPVAKPVTNKRVVSVEITSFRPADIPSEWTARETAEKIGRSAGDWLDGRIAAALVRGLPFDTKTVDLSKSGISKQTFINARGKLLEDGYPQMSAICAVLPANWYVTMLSKDMPIRDMIYRESLGGGIEIVFRPQEELLDPDDGRQRGFIFTQESLRWAESGWLSEVARDPMGIYSDVDLDRYPKQPDGEIFENILNGGGAVLRKAAGIFELKGRKLTPVKSEIRMESTADMSYA